MAIPNSPYNLTDLYAADRVQDLFIFANDVTDQVLMGIFLLAVFFIMLLAMRRYEFTNTLLVASFVCFILSLFLRYAELLNFLYVIAFLVLTSFTAFYSFVVNR